MSVQASPLITESPIVPLSLLQTRLGVQQLEQTHSSSPSTHRLHGEYSILSPLNTVSNIILTILVYLCCQAGFLITKPIAFFVHLQNNSKYTFLKILKVMYMVVYMKVGSSNTTTYVRDTGVCTSVVLVNHN